MTAWGADRRATVWCETFFPSASTLCVCTSLWAHPRVCVCEKKQQLWHLRSSTPARSWRASAQNLQITSGPRGVSHHSHTNSCSLTHLTHSLALSFLSFCPVVMLSFCMRGLPRHLHRYHIFHSSSSLLTPFFLCYSVSLLLFPRHCANLMLHFNSCRPFLPQTLTERMQAGT